MVVMIQKEVAERITAAPGSKAYGALSVAVQYYTKPEIVLDVGRKSFIPVPEVDSAVIRCNFYKQPPVLLEDEKLFFRVVRGAFAQRRKTLANSLKSSGIDPKIIEAAGIDGRRRGETLSIEEFAQIANMWAVEQKKEK